MTWKAFRPDHSATFVDRPNRFVVRVRLGAEVVESHCPNPGRLTELLFPGVPVILEKAQGERKLAYTLVAVQRPGPHGPVTIPLASVRSNALVQALALPLLFPQARRIQPEFALEGSRFDFLVEDGAGRHLVEVKACSEVEYDTALFPDAPSLRARRHLEELADWGDRGYVPHVIFAVGHGRPRSWGPNVHTDPGFAQTLVRLAPRLHLHALVFETQADGATRLVEPHLPIDLSPSGPDSGLLVHLSPGETGWLVRLQWMASGLEKAVAKAPARLSFSLRCAEDRRATWQQDLEAAGGWPVGEGVLAFPTDPRTNPAFVDRIMRWRHSRW